MRTGHLAPRETNQDTHVRADADLLLPLVLGLARLAGAGCGQRLVGVHLEHWSRCRDTEMPAASGTPRPVSPFGCIHRAPGWYGNRKGLQSSALSASWPRNRCMHVPVRRSSIVDCPTESMDTQVQNFDAGRATKARLAEAAHRAPMRLNRNVRSPILAPPESRPTLIRLSKL